MIDERGVCCILYASVVVKMRECLRREVTRDAHVCGCKRVHVGQFFDYVIRGGGDFAEVYILWLG